MSDSEVSRSNLMAISIEALYDGMFVQEEIYDADAVMLIATPGVILNAESIERIRSLNGGRDGIYVSRGTYKLLYERSQPVNVASRRDLEENTGYAEAKDNTFELLDEIAQHKVVQQKALQTVSAELSARLEMTSPATILSLINALAPVDEYLQRHCVNVSLLNGLIGRWLGLPKKDVDTLVLIGLMHDCGKALVPPQILNAQRKLTGVEFEVIKMHPVYTYELLVGFHEDVRRAARLHHEKINGDGYPDRLSNDSIPLEARITAVSDIYDAMSSQRTYKKAQSPFHTLAMMSALKGSDLDSALVEVFHRYMPLELMNKPVMLSNGSVGVVRSFDSDDPEFPMIEVNNQIIKSGKSLYCTSMYMRE